jgi:DNA invertase Pin-like site-specific DNA recombinase
MKRFVGYCRVSTVKQGQSGLGLEAQLASLRSFVDREGGELISSPFIEVESGKIKNRPELNRAILFARKNKAILLVAKIDRLARNVSFLANLLESGVEFVACDNPHATRLTIHILAACAEEEARAISSRTKAALQAAKARGVKLGSARLGHWQGREDRRRLGQILATNRAAELKRKNFRFENFSEIEKILQLRNQGMSFRGISQNLNSEIDSHSKGNLWNAMKIHRLLKRIPDRLVTQVAKIELSITA